MRLSSFDVYPKTLQEFRQRTLTGAIVSVCTIGLVALLTIFEVVDFAQVQTKHHLYVDTARGSSQMRINVNISFPALPCSVILLDTLDLSGNHAPMTAHSIVKTQLDANGRPLPSTKADTPTAGRPGRVPLFDSKGGHNHGAAAGKSLKELGQAAGRGDVLLSALLSELLPTVFEDKEAIAELRTHIGEGCHIEGSVTVNKVAGNFHFAMTKADHHVLMNVFKQKESINVSHVIHSISFGDVYPGMFNPLDDMPKIVHEGSGYFQYHIKVVPTLYEPWYGEPVLTNQFSYTELFRTTHELDKFPAVYFHYEFSPIIARYTKSRRTYSSFLTGLCAIVGGVFTVAVGLRQHLSHSTPAPPLPAHSFSHIALCHPREQGMVDSCLHRITKRLAL